MSRFYRLFFIGLWLCSASSAYAIAPEVIHAVADKPLTLSLESGETLRVDVVAVMESSFIAVSPDGEVMSLDYENIASVKIATTAEPKTEVAPAHAPSQARTAPTPPPTQSASAPVASRTPEQIRADRQQADAARREAARAGVSAGPRPSGHAAASRATVARSYPATPGTPARSTHQRDEDHAGALAAATPFPRVFARISLDLAFGSMRAHLEERGSSEQASIRYRGLALGGDAALGVRVSRTAALHATFGVRRLLVPAARVKAEDYWDKYDTGFIRVDDALRSMNIGFGFSVFPKRMVLSASIGGAQDGAQEWGVGGDFMLGYAGSIGQNSRMGFALANTWMVKPRDADGVQRSGYSFGPRVFLAY